MFKRTQTYPTTTSTTIVIASAVPLAQHKRPKLH